MWRLLAYLFDLIVVVLIGRLIGWILRAVFGTSPAGTRTVPGGGGHRDEPITSGQTARDPVCGMFVSTEVSHKLNEGGRTRHFCSRECLEAYQKKGASVS